MSDLESDNLGEATPSDVAEEAVSNEDDDVVMHTGEDSGAVSDPGASPPDQEMDSVMT